MVLAEVSSRTAMLDTGAEVGSCAMALETAVGPASIRLMLVRELLVMRLTGALPWMPYVSFR